MDAALRILFVEDDAILRRAVVRLFSRVPGAVVIDEAATVEEAARCIAAASPDLMLLDVRLRASHADAGGLEVLRHARLAGCEAPAIFLSGLDDRETVRAALRGGAVDFILKSELDKVDLESLVRRARRHLGASPQVDASPTPTVDSAVAAVLAVPGTLKSKLAAVEQAILERALRECDENKSAAARLLGVERKALERKLRKARLLAKKQRP